MSFYLPAYIKYAKNCTVKEVSTNNFIIKKNQDYANNRNNN